MDMITLFMCLMAGFVIMLGIVFIFILREFMHQDKLITEQHSEMVDAIGKLAQIATKHREEIAHDIVESIKHYNEEAAPKKHRTGALPEEYKDAPVRRKKDKRNDFVGEK